VHKKIKAAALVMGMAAIAPLVLAGLLGNKAKTALLEWFERK
jgi:hypothetical protein